MALLASVLLLAAPLAVAAEAPLEVVDASGARRELALQAAETALIVHFWASWCPECAEELPRIERAAARCAGSVSVVTVNVGESRETADAFRARHGLTLPLLRDPEGRLWRRFARGLPANLIQTREDRTVVMGPYSDGQWAERLRTLGCADNEP